MARLGRGPGCGSTWAGQCCPPQFGQQTRTGLVAVISWRKRSLQTVLEAEECWLGSCAFTYSVLLCLIHD